MQSSTTRVVLLSPKKTVDANDCSAVAVAVSAKLWFPDSDRGDWVGILVFITAMKIRAPTDNARTQLKMTPRILVSGLISAADAMNRTRRNGSVYSDARSVAVTAGARCSTFLVSKHQPLALG